MSCTISSISSGGGEDWIDLPIPAAQVVERVNAPGSSWNINDLTAAIDQVMTQVCSSINLLGYKEFKYGVTVAYGAGQLYTMELKLTRNDVQKAIESLIAYYQAKPSTQVIDVNAGITISVSSSNLVTPPFHISLTNGRSSVYRIEARCDLYTGSYSIDDTRYMSVYSLKARN